MKLYLKLASFTERSGAKMKETIKENTGNTTEDFLLYSGRKISPNLVDREILTWEGGEGRKAITHTER
jgi:hypothetical protein